MPEREKGVLREAMKKIDKQIYTFTKEWVNRLMWLFVIWISLTYVLAFIGKESIAEALSQDVMTGGAVLYVGGGYNCGLNCGLFCLVGDSSASYSYGDIGSRLQKLP